MSRIGHEYGNFRDPLGLVMRMLRSRDRAARSALTQAGLGLFAGPLDRTLAALERRRLAAAEPSNAPVILIVGPPRSGTTLVYQVLAHFLPVAYFNNLSALFPRSPISASVALNRFLGAPRADVHSFYGNTAGLAGPNDAFHIWNRWLGIDRYMPALEIDAAARADMRAFFAAAAAAFGRPILNKNNRNSACMPLLADALENVWFVEVRRNPIFTAQSLVLARERVQGSRYAAWGLASTDSEPARGADGYIADVCRQLHTIDMQLQEGKRRVGLERVIELSYEGFCADPARAVAQIHQRIWDRPFDERNVRRSLRRLDPTNDVQLDDREFLALERCISTMYGARAAAGN